MRAEYPHHVWAIDFQFDQTMDGRMLKWSYPDSVDRCQGFTGESLRVLMNCCS